MKFPASLVPLIFLTFFISCKSPADRLNKHFKKVNESIDKSHDEIIKSMGKKYDYILSQQESHPRLVPLADTLYNASLNAVEYITSVQKMLNDADSSGTSLSTANNLLGKGPHGDTLTHVLFQVYKSITACPASNGNKFIIALLMRDIKTFGTEPGRKKTYFRFTPTMTALTSLGSFKTSILTGASLVMNDMAFIAAK